MSATQPELADSRERILAQVQWEVYLPFTYQMDPGLS
jgi:hypothetical protein